MIEEETSWEKRWFQYSQYGSLDFDGLHHKSRSCLPFRITCVQHQFSDGFFWSISFFVLYLRKVV